MDDVISRQQAIVTAVNAAINWHKLANPQYSIAYCIGEAMRQLPSAQPKKGKWISADAIFGGVPFYCSECGENTWDTVMGKPRWNYCPMCGAKMEVTT